MLKKAEYVDGAKAAWPAGVPQLPQLFYIGQLVRCIVTELVRTACVTCLPGALTQARRRVLGALT